MRALSLLHTFSLTALISAAAMTAQASTLTDIQQRGDLNCGVYPDDPGRSALDREGRWQGFYVEFCRGVAAAVLKNPNFVNFVEVGPTSRFTSLVDYSTDVVMYSSTWTLGRENAYQVSFPALYLFDGQGFVVRKSSNIETLADLNDKTVCVTGNTTTQQNLEDYISTQQLDTKVVYANGDRFFRGSVCDAYSADRMNLATNLANRVDNHGDYFILPDTLSREPIGPTVRNDDAQWQKIVRSVVHATILAEEKGITQANIDQIKQSSQNVEVQNLLGVSGDIGPQMGLDQDWAYRVIKGVGNYAEIYDRHFGPDTPIGQERGLNALWRDGGVLFAPPFK
ncbi:General L-amino acid-binding periplasmic protein AapJ precursor [Marinomonas aquimarina]|uniref:General L-amino acid-binding periplasmic protein AapJ n=1 Tax=Marinomonas aquimarina TaxID=295068 RepID=A0A1A8TJ99_9GAMM|nr:amino acid ABC transporter substrate-binding protein [Marinomonas aquimarina]SBS32592.1 General L-amino acid-binding periplasmic protein AapJ precursor [Marinomonas aquimarina]